MMIFTIISAFLSASLVCAKFYGNSTSRFFVWIESQLGKFRWYAIGAVAALGTWLFDLIRNLFESAVHITSSWVRDLPRPDFLDDAPDWLCWFLDNGLDWNAFESDVSTFLTALFAALAARLGFAAVKLVIELL